MTNQKKLWKQNKYILCLLYGYVVYQNKSNTKRKSDLKKKIVKKSRWLPGDYFEKVVELKMFVIWPYVLHEGTAKEKAFQIKLQFEFK